MGVIEAPTEDECYLYALLADASGIDQAEFTWQDPENDTMCWRAWPFQWPWFRCQEPLQIDQCGRAVGKSTSIKIRAFAFPFLHPKTEMVITAPELVHLNPIVGLIEGQFRETRLGREMMKKGANQGVTHRPFQMDFVNGARIIGRIPQRDGKGVKGTHPLHLELDEGQDYPQPGYTELIETVKRGHAGATWRIHGVTRGVHDYFFKFTQPGSGWTVHRFCLPGGTLVYGPNGPTPIEGIEEGAKVWSITEDGQLVPDQVTGWIDNGVKPTWRVKAKGGFDLTTTGNHPYLVLRREGTKGTRKEIAFEWVDAEDIVPGDVIICVDHLPATGGGAEVDLDEITQVVSSPSPQRRIPGWVWRADQSQQRAFLAGYLLGDGSLSKQAKGQNAWAIGSASLEMTRELRALCHYLGIRTTTINVNNHVTDNGISKGPQYRFYAYTSKSWFRQIPRAYAVDQLAGLDDHFVARTVVESAPTGAKLRTYDISVGDRHNFIADGVVVHNTGMHRPNWTDQERQEKIEMYGSRDHPDYRRNILGLHGDATSPLFVTSRLMACVDIEQTSDYNLEEYQHFRLRSEQLEDLNDDIVGFLDFPRSHLKKGRKFWVGMDVGYTDHPSEILVFAEEQDSSDGEPKSVLRLLTRIHLERIGTSKQAEAILHVCDFYNVEAFAMDKTGNGLPLYQLVQELRPKLAHKIKGYNFSEKILVDFDDTIEFDADLEDEIKKRGIERRVLEYASDKLRELVDDHRLRLPWDTELIGEFQGQTYVVLKSAIDMYGRKSYDKGTFHALDGARMAALAFVQQPIEELTKDRKPAPVLDLFLG